MTETTVLLIGTIIITAIIVGFLIYRYNQSVKTLNETIDDKKVIINELVEYAEKVATTQESVKIKKSSPKKQKETKKVEEKPTKKGRKPKQKWSIVRNGKGWFPENPSKLRGFLFWSYVKILYISSN